MEVAGAAAPKGSMTYGFRTMDEVGGWSPRPKNRVLRLEAGILGPKVGDLGSELVS